ncbi:unnamed protein product [Linum trigynum]|uniref:Uncharacterized protein n=1 Tax=Linum trigynum TaxID=586398 RepID=A0AAV2F3P1_9ROSI
MGENGGGLLGEGSLRRRQAAEEQREGRAATDGLLTGRERWKQSDPSGMRARRRRIQAVSRAAFTAEEVLTSG